MARTAVQPAVEPMLAKLARELPEGEGERERKASHTASLPTSSSDPSLQSGELKPLNRYFPELEAALLRELPERGVVYGEIVIAGKAGLDFEALLLRIHPLRLV